MYMCVCLCVCVCMCVNACVSERENTCMQLAFLSKQYLHVLNLYSSLIIDRSNGTVVPYANLMHKVRTTYTQKMALQNSY